MDVIDKISSYTKLARIFEYIMRFVRKMKNKTATFKVENCHENYGLICQPDSVDFCGPLFTTLKIRGRPPVKTYIAVFVCFTSEAVNFELTTDLSSDIFIFGLKRFIARRGISRTVPCDNRMNFVGAQRKLRDVRVQFELGNEPRARYFAGLKRSAKGCCNGQ